MLVLYVFFVFFQALGQVKKPFYKHFWFFFFFQPFGIDDVIGCYLDLNNGTIEFAKNGNFNTRFNLLHSKASQLMSCADSTFSNVVCLFGAIDPLSI